MKPITAQEKLAVILYNMAHLDEGDFDPRALVKYNGEIVLAVQRMRETPEVFDPWVELATKQMAAVGLKGGALRRKSSKRPRGTP